MLPENWTLKWEEAILILYRVGNYQRLIRSQSFVIFFKLQEEYIVVSSKVFKKYIVNLYFPWENIFDTLYMLNVLLEAGDLVVHKTNEVPVSWSIMSRKLINIYDPFKWWRVLWGWCGGTV